MVLVYGGLLHHETHGLLHLEIFSGMAISGEIHTCKYADEAASWMSFHATSAAMVTVLTKTYKVSVTIPTAKARGEGERGGLGCYIDAVQQFAIDDILEDPSI